MSMKRKLNRTWQKWIRKLQAYLDRWTMPDKDQLVMALCLNTASLELTKDEFVEFAPIRGCCGPFKLTGNSCPVFEYRMFDKPMMEFVKVRVEVSRPDRMHFECTIDSTTAPERHGEVIPADEKYKHPFKELAWHLYRYFPLYPSADKRAKSKAVA